MLQAVVFRLSNTNYAEHWSSPEVIWPLFENLSMPALPSPLFILHRMFPPCIMCVCFLTKSMFYTWCYITAQEHVLGTILASSCPQLVMVPQRQ